ncbi:MAG: HAMP domain-containing histidine kinase [Alphaproteobacteria bacterium]|nr:HAMP domain-containing histidine kinase [Alphaproteobacteria bacterium]
MTSKNVGKIQEDTLVNKALARAAHDMRNPLQVISGNADLIVLQAKDATLKFYAGRIVEYAHYLSGIIDDMADFSLDATLDGDVETFGNLILVIQEQCREKAESNAVEVKFEVQFDENIPALVCYRIGRILSNLLDNAINACPGGTVLVRVEKESDTLNIVIEDSGSGLNYDPGLDEPVLSMSRKGLGIGIVCSLVQNLNGKICWKSQPKSRAEISIPL